MPLSMKLQYTVHICIKLQHWKTEQVKKILTTENYHINLLSRVHIYLLYRGIFYVWASGLYSL